MRFFLTIHLFFISWIGFAQVDSIGLKNAMLQLDRALLEKDSVVLSKLLSTDLSFGHSNGWVQTKKDVWNDFTSGKLDYKKIENRNSVIASISKKWATVRINTDVEGKLGEKDFKMKLHVLQVWMKTKNGWRLFARQSAKLN